MNMGIDLSDIVEITTVSALFPCDKLVSLPMRNSLIMSYIIIFREVASSPSYLPVLGIRSEDNTSSTC